MAGPKELEQFGLYHFNLAPSTSLDADSKFIITLPPDLGAQDSGVCLEPSSAGTCTVTGPSTLKVDDLMPSGYTDLNTFIEFTLILKNPKKPIEFAILSIFMNLMDSVETISYHMGSINLANLGYYDPHELTNMNIIPESDIAVTKTKYNFTFTNTQYWIPVGATIQILFPGDVQYIGTDPPTVNNLQNIAVAMSSIFTYPILTISDAFPSDLGADRNMQFVVEDILNPYGIMETPSFQIILYTNGDVNQKLFENTNGPTISTVNTCAFPGVSIVPVSLRTSEKVIYSFTVELGAGALNTSHLIEFTPPPAISMCYKDTLTSTSAYLSIGTITQTPAHAIYFEIGSNIPAYSIITFEIECINPYTTCPSTAFIILGRSSVQSFYTAEVNIPDMNIINDYDTVSVTRPNEYPKALNTFTFGLRATNEYATTYINQIKVYVSGLEIDPSFVVSIVFGIATTGFSYSESGGIITIAGITSLNQNFQFEIENLRNPSLSTIPIIMSIATVHSDGYVGENMTTSTSNIACNFPCKSCISSGAPDVCTSCFPQDDEVFGGGASLHMISDGECLGGCPLHTYILSAACFECHSSCNQCEGGNYFDNCTKCYPNTNKFLYNKQCIDPPCPAGYIHNELNWNCIGTYIYIYIYI